jgi:hypothetical protein
MILISGKIVQGRLMIDDGKESGISSGHGLLE